MKGFLALTAVLLGAALYWEHGRRMDLEEKSHGVAAMELQGRCASQAKIKFAEGPWAPGAAYESHFNARLGRCFMKVDEYGGGSIAKTITDAFEGKIVGAFFSGPIVNGKSGTPILCSFTGADGEDVYCRSTQEFENSTEHFMTE